MKPCIESYVEVDGKPFVGEITFGGADKQVAIELDPHCYTKNANLRPQAIPVIEEMINDIFNNSESVIKILSCYNYTFEELEAYFLNRG